MAQAATSANALDQRVHWPALVVAAVLWLLFFRVDTMLGFSARFGGPAGVFHRPMLDFLYIKPNEYSFWMLHAGVALPAAALTGWSLAPAFARVRAATLRVCEGSDKDWRRLVWFYGLVLFALAKLMYSLVLLDGPVTDDENTVLFGAQIWGRGALSAPMPNPRSAFFLPFTYLSDEGMISSMDFPGAIAVSFIAWASHLNQLLYAAMAAGTGVFVVKAVNLLWGRRAALTTMLVWALCPMVVWLSATTHTHNASRFFIAASFYLLARAESEFEGETGLNPRTLLWLGFVAGFGFCVRPAEVGGTLAPLGVLWAVRALAKGPGARKGLLLALAGMALPLVLFGAYNHAITGDALVQARFVPDKILATKIPPNPPWERLGLNVGHNFSLLMVFFMGPVGAVLLAAGVLQAGRGRTRGTFLLALLLGMVLHLGMGMLHDDVGIHVLGPMHYLDATPGLTLLAAAGWSAMDSGLSAHGSEASNLRPRLFAAFVTVMLLGFGSFNWIHGRSVHESCELRDKTVVALDEAQVHNAVIFAPPRGVYYNEMPESSGSWVVQNPMPSPYFDGDRIFVSFEADVPTMRALFPDRRMVYLLFDPATGTSQLTEMERDRPAPQLRAPGGGGGGPSHSGG